MTVLCINAYVDPFRLLSSTIQPDSQNFVPKGDAELVLHFKQQLLAASTVPTVMVGSSRTERGYDTCDLNIQKSTIEGINKEQMLGLAEMAIKNPKVSHLIIELSGLVTPSETKIGALTTLDKINTLMSLNMLRQSIRLMLGEPKLPFVESSHTANRPQNAQSTLQSEYTPLTKCEARPVRTILKEDTFLLQKIQRLYRKMFFGSDFTSHFNDALTQLQRYCHDAARSHPVAISIIIGPVHKALFAPTQLTQVKSRSKAIVTNYQNSLCPITMHSAAVTKATQQNENWYDYNHFSEKLGNPFLMQVIQ